MARFIYEWKPTQHGNRLFRRPSAAVKASIERAPEPETADYGSLLKADLVEAAEDRALDPSGTKADIIARLEDDDADAD